MSNRLPVPDRRLALMQLSDSLFPSGSFYSISWSRVTHPLWSNSISRRLSEFMRLLLQQSWSIRFSCTNEVPIGLSVVDNLEEVRRADLKLFAQTLVEEAREHSVKVVEPC